MMYFLVFGNGCKIDLQSRLYDPEEFGTRCQKQDFGTSKIAVSDQPLNSNENLATVPYDLTTVAKRGFITPPSDTI